MKKVQVRVFLSDDCKKVLEGVCSLSAIASIAIQSMRGVIISDALITSYEVNTSLNKSVRVSIHKELYDSIPEEIQFVWMDKRLNLSDMPKVKDIKNLRPSKQLYVNVAIEALLTGMIPLRVQGCSSLFVGARYLTEARSKEEARENEG